MLEILDWRKKIIEIPVTTWVLNIELKACVQDLYSLKFTVGSDGKTMVGSPMISPGGTREATLGSNLINPFIPTVPTLKPLRDDSALRALSSLRGLRGAPEVPPLCRETSVSRTANVGTVGMNGFTDRVRDRVFGAGASGIP